MVDNDQRPLKFGRRNPIERQLQKLKHLSFVVVASAEQDDGGLGGSQVSQETRTIEVGRYDDAVFDAFA